MPQIGRNPVSVLKLDSPSQEHPFLVLLSDLRDSRCSYPHIYNYKYKQKQYKCWKNITYTCGDIDTYKSVGHANGRQVEKCIGKFGRKSRCPVNGNRFRSSLFPFPFLFLFRCASLLHRCPFARLTFFKQIQLRTPLGDVSVSVLLVSGLRRPIYRLPKKEKQDNTESATRTKTKSNLNSNLNLKSQLIAVCVCVCVRGVERNKQPNTQPTAATMLDIKSSADYLSRSTGSFSNFSMLFAGEWAVCEPARPSATWNPSNYTKLAP